VGCGLKNLVLAQAIGGMDNVTLIRVVAGVLFVVVLFILVQRRKKRMSR